MAKSARRRSPSFPSRSTEEAWRGGGGEGGEGEFVTRLAGADSVGAINFGRSDTFGGDAKTAARSAAATAFAIIENRWKLTQSGEAPTTEVKYEEGTGGGPWGGGASPAKGETPANCF